MGKKDIEKHQYKKGQSGNPKGRPPKLVTKILNELKVKGEVVTSNTVTQVFKVFLSLTLKEVVEISKNKSYPIIYTLTAKAIIKDGFEVIEKLLDRANGRPTQMHQQSIDMKVSKDSLTDEEIEERLRQLDKD